MKSKIGDVIVITDGPGTGLNEEDTYKKATVVKVDDIKVWIKASEIGAPFTSNYYVLHDCYELESVYNSPLYKALS